MGFVAHRARPVLKARHPVHVTVRLVAGVPSMRMPRAFAALRAAIVAGRERFGFRLVHFSVQSNHLHWIVEAEDARSLSRGVQGLLVRIARALNKTWRRRGEVFGDRYHAHALTTPRETRNALTYVLRNAHHHGVRLPPRSSGIDPFASRAAAPVAAARTWLLATAQCVSAVPGGRRGSGASISARV